MVADWVGGALAELGVREWQSGSASELPVNEMAGLISRLPHPVEVVILDLPLSPDGDRPPRFAIRELVPVGGPEIWEDKDSGASGPLAIFSEGIQSDHPPASLVQALMEAGARLVVCFECGDFLTDGYSEWPGTWCALDEEGPVCQGGFPPARHAPKRLTQ